ncbi:hypothetical protein Cgig2_017543 [Carnegiea gigantea]|uniref:Neprosin PEP catalytic domain-containing protein n=1 Tax=Carnegiea gigantea TaxID=171969 RepID=A0A9Q1QLK0_9CARY|nr:hypothetical protein Cgig2_017543 [Carnegiea gigantea]
MCECDIIFWKQFSGIILKGAFHQVHANIRIDKPEVGDHHRSGAYISIESGVDDIYNKIQVGWIVMPGWYHHICSTSTIWVRIWMEELFITSYLGLKGGGLRLESAWFSPPPWMVSPEIEGDNNTECFYHHHCPGFMATNTSPLTLGSKLNPSKVGHDPINVLQLTLTQDNSSGVWYFHGGPYLPTLGYWKRDYFASLTGVAGAVVARFGGEVFTPEDSKSSPPMGTGQFKYPNYYRTCYFDDIKVNSKDPVQDDLQVVETRCYLVSEVPGEVPNGFGFFFGGKGGQDMEQCVY